MLVTLPDAWIHEVADDGAYLSRTKSGLPKPS